MINRFADLTGDHQWIHVDVERAKRESPFKGTIAHGFLTLSLLPAHAARARRGSSPATATRPTTAPTSCASCRRSRPARRSTRARRLIGVEPHPKGTQVTQEINGPRGRQRQAGAHLRDGGALPSADEALKRGEWSSPSATRRTRGASPSSRISLIAANVAVFLLVTLPLGGEHPRRRRSRRCRSTCA